MEEGGNFFRIMFHPIPFQLNKIIVGEIFKGNFFFSGRGHFYSTCSISFQKEKINIQKI
jgi:hypothetical protein